MIWLIDYTTYKTEIDGELKKYRADYFRVKSYKRKTFLGDTAPAQTRTYSNGLLRIATLLKQSGVDCRYMHYGELEEILEKGAPLPPVIAFSTVCPTVPKAARLARRIKDLSPRTKVYAGGPQINNAPQLTAKNFKEFDKLIVGRECEAASQIAGVAVKSAGQYVDYSLLPMGIENYAINTLTALGCPYRCSYCADGRVPHTEVSDDAMISRLKKLLPERNLVHVFDSVFGLTPERALKICKNLQEADHKLILSCDMRAEFITEKLVTEMQKAGFAEIRLGIESADDEMLETNGRTLRSGKCIEKLKIIRDCSDIYITLYSVTGLPGTTADGHKRTTDMFRNLLLSHSADEIKNALYVPYPYDDTDYSKRGVRILDDDWEHYDRQSYPVFDTPLLDRKTIWGMYLETAKVIADSWLESMGFSSYDDIPDTDGYYSEYVETNYNIKNTGDK